MNAYDFTDAELGRIAALALACPIMRNPDQREVVRQGLPFGMSILLPGPDDMDVGSIVRAATARINGLEALLGGIYRWERLTEQMGALFEELQVIRPQPVTWQEVTVLRWLLDLARVPDVEAQRQFRTIMGDLPPLPPSEGEGRLFFAVINYLAKTSARPPDQAPLLEFLERCRDFLGPPVAKEDLEHLERWFKAISDRLGIDRAQIRARAVRPAGHSAAAASDPVLLISIAPALAVEGAFLVDAWLFLYAASEAPTHVELTARSASDAHRRDELPDVIRELVAASLDYLPDPALEPALEILLPLQMLNWDIDQREIRIGRQTLQALGDRYRLAVRSWDRLYDRDYRLTWPQWYQNWKRRFPAPRHVTEADVFWGKAQADYENGFYDGLARSGLLFLGIHLAPPAVSGTIEDTLAILLDAGVPIAVWLRHQPVDLQLAGDCIRSLVFEEPLECLPGRIRDRRRGQLGGNAAPATDCLWEHVTLLWDDPGRVPPDTRARMRPAE